MWQFFSHIWWFPYLFFSHLTVSSLYCAVPLSHVTFLLSYWVVPLLFSQTWRFHPHIMQFQITCNSSFLTFGGSLTFFSHLTVLSSHYAVPTSHVIVLSHIGWFLYFFLTLDGFILTLCSSNITCDSFFLTFGGSLTFFSHIWRFLHCAVPTSHVTVFFLHLVVPLLFFLTFDSFILIFNFVIESLAYQPQW